MLRDLRQEAKTLDDVHARCVLAGLVCATRLQSHTLLANEGRFEEGVDDLRKDRGFMLQAVRDNLGAFKDASKELKEDPEFVAQMRYQEKIDMHSLLHWVSKWVPEKKKDDKDFMLAVVRKWPEAIFFASSNLKSNQEFMSEVINWSPKPQHITIPKAALESMKAGWEKQDPNFYSIATDKGWKFFTKEARRAAVGRVPLSRGRQPSSTLHETLPETLHEPSHD